MSYVAIRPVILFGNQYYAGDYIDPAHIEEGRAKALIASGRIAEVAATGIEAPDPKEGTVNIAVPVFGADGEELTLTMPADEVVKAILILQVNSEKAIKAIKAAGSEDMLILVHALDTRASVKKAAQAQAEKLAAQ